VLHSKIDKPDKDCDIVYFCPELNAATDAVFHSQVLQQIVALQDMGYRCGLVAGGAHVTASDCEMSIEGVVGDRYAFVGNNEATTPWEYFRMARRVSKKAAVRRIVCDARYVYYRSLLTFLASNKAFEACGVQTVFDCRGLMTREAWVKRFGSENALLALVDVAERLMIHRATRVLCVSQKMAEMIKSVDGVVPCCANPTMFAIDNDLRQIARRDLGWGDDEIGIVYSGGISRWQRVEETVKLLHDLHKRVPKLRSLLLVKLENQSTVKAMMPSNAPQFSIRSAEPGEVCRWLNAADFGVVLRHDLQVNRVASPIKIGEYLLCGLALIASPNIGDISAILRQQGIGLIADDLTEAGVNQLAEQIVQYAKPRMAARELGLQHYVRSNYRMVYEKVLGKPLNLQDSGSK